MFEYELNSVKLAFHSDGEGYPTIELKFEGEVMVEYLLDDDQT